MDPKENNKDKSSEIKADQNVDTSLSLKKTKEDIPKSTTNKSGKNGG